MIKRRDTGVALVMAILILVVLGILIPALIILQKKDSTDTVDSDRKTKAFQLAEAGQDRASWKLRESDTMWTSATMGITITGYNNDVVYSDVSGGNYKILIASGPGLSQVTITTKGLATGQTDNRAIKGIYTKGNTIGAMSVNGALQYKPNLLIEWGPVITYSSITQAPANYYPRKYSAGLITGRDTVNDSNNGALPSGNWAAYDYVAFYDLGTAPTVKLSYYLTKAKATVVGTLLKKGTGSGDATPYNAGGFSSGYYPASSNPNGVKMEKGTGAGNFSFVCSTCVIYIEGDLQRWPSGSWVNCEAVIVTGDMDFNAGGTVYSATIPSTAQDEYQYSPTATAYWASKGWTNGGTYSVTDAGFHGFLYAGGNVSNAGGGSTIVGALFVNGNVTTNTTTVYYDSTVSANIQFSNAAITRVSWDEIRTSW